MPGRPTSCTPDRVQVIIDALEHGNTRKTAANLAGVSAEVLKSWITQMPDLKTQIELAEAQFQAAVVKTLFDAATSGSRPSWQAGITMLSRRDPMAWGDIQRFEVYQKIDEITTLHEELARQGINVSMQQLINDMQQIQQGNKNKKLRGKKQPTVIDIPALNAPAE